jgi:uncharacterized protein (TIGR03437 family)
MSRVLWQPRLWLVCLIAGIGQCSAFAQSPSAPAPFGKYTENINGVPMELVRIPNGKFIMGNDRSPNPEEKPAHLVSLKSFYLGQYEVTRGQWNFVRTLPKINRDLEPMFIGTSNGWTREETTPADFLFWDDAIEFCGRLSRFTGKTYRLPSEAEWEYACRASTTTEYSFGDQIDYSLAHMKNSLSTEPVPLLLPVGKKGYSNKWGLFDMHGNAGEWCLDAEHPNYIGAPTDGSAWGLGGGAQRGGYYGVKEEFGRSASRLFWTRNLRISTFGFRVVAEVTPTIGTGSIAATSAANYLPQNLSAYSLGSLFGVNLSTEIKAAESLLLPTTLAGVSVFVKDVLGDEHLAQLLFVSPTQINFHMPAELPTGTANVYAVLNGNIHSSGTINIVNTSPGLFTADATGKGFAAAVVQRVKSTGESTYEAVTHFDPVQNRIVALPIDLASRDGEEVFLALFGTGIRGRSSLVNATAQVGASVVEVLYAGVQPDFAGLDQINLRLPKSLMGSGEVNIIVSVDGLEANPVKVNIK